MLIIWDCEELVKPVQGLKLDRLKSRLKIRKQILEIAEQFSSRLCFISKDYCAKYFPTWTRDLKKYKPNKNAFLKNINNLQSCFIVNLIDSRNLKIKAIVSKVELFIIKDLLFTKCIILKPFRMFNFTVLLFISFF